MHIVVMVSGQVNVHSYWLRCRSSAVEMDNFHRVVGSAGTMQCFLCALPPTILHTQNYIDSVGSHGCVSVCVCIFETAGG